MARRKCSGDLAKAEVSIINSIYHCCKRCARKRQTRYLPQEIVFQFLLHLPAQLLHDVVRTVCREWSLIIRSPNFACHHYRDSTGGVLIQPRTWPRVGLYVEMRRGRLEISKFDYGFDDVVRSSCNGLVVTCHRTQPTVTYICNPLTKQLTVLPPFSIQDACYSDCGLAFVEASMVYKVARACGDKFNVPKTQIAVLTIGVDRVWRYIDIRHLLLSAEEGRFFNLPLVTGGYVHWVTFELVLTLNLETETVSRFSRPQWWGVFGAMGSNLSFIQFSVEFWWDVWEMNSVTGEWSMLFRIDKGPINERFKGMFTEHATSVIPMCWLAAREILVCALTSRQGSSGIAYNVKTGEIQSFEWKGLEGFVMFTPHVNSLLWWENQN